MYFWHYPEGVILDDGNLEGKNLDHILLKRSKRKWFRIYF